MTRSLRLYHRRKDVRNDFVVCGEPSPKSPLSSHLKILPTVDSLRHDKTLPGGSCSPALRLVLRLQPGAEGPVAPESRPAGLWDFGNGDPRLASAPLG